MTDPIKLAEDADKQHAPGWYDYHGGKRFYDGAEWTDAYAYVPPSGEQLGFWEMTGAVCFGVIGGLALWRLGADVAPDVFFVPIKVVVEDLPRALQ